MKVAFAFGLFLGAFVIPSYGAFVIPTLPRAVPRAAASRPRIAIARCNFLDTLGKIADYNKKFLGTALSSAFDDRTARASHVLFGFAKYANGEADAASIKARIESGELSFADAAKEYSSCPSASRGGDLGTFKRGAMVPEFDEVCFNEATPIGSGVSMVKTQFGWHLVTVYERTEKSS